jgi:cysteinylglycine-S-conjugate dipeptidase
MITHEHIQTKVTSLMPEIRQALEALVRIPSVSFPEFDPQEVRRSAELTRELLERAGMQTRIL